ncbi:MAG: hypothetical protein HY848_19020 [Betaproteobacteria bacterium]|nr:hypothetical protein [Betaproteobacteria bacterium]
MKANVIRRTVAALALLAAPLARAAPQVIELNQVPCQFLESEDGVNQGYKSRKIQDCEAINASTAAARLARAKTLELRPGQYIFRVTNKSVPYELGFWLRGAGLVGRASLPSVSGGGLTQGVTKDYEIVLKPGEYVYSCPLNTTPDYRLIVTN